MRNSKSKFITNVELSTPRRGRLKQWQRRQDDEDSAKLLQSKKREEILPRRVRLPRSIRIAKRGLSTTYHVQKKLFGNATNWSDSICNVEERKVSCWQRKHYTTHYTQTAHMTSWRRGACAAVSSFLRTSTTPSVANGNF